MDIEIRCSKCNGAVNCSWNFTTRREPILEIVGCEDCGKKAIEEARREGYDEGYDEGVDSVE
jgi:hypothetical protein